MGAISQKSAEFLIRSRLADAEAGDIDALFELGVTYSTGRGGVAADLIDRVVVYFAPVLIGGGGPSALMGPGAPSIDAAWRLRLDEVTRIGTDTRVVARHPGRLSRLLGT